MKYVDESEHGKENLSKKNEQDAGLDICANEDCTIFPNNSKLISTGIYIEVPEGHVGLIWPRSGLAIEHGLTIGAGCIDNNYHDEIKILLFNHNRKSFEIKPGDRIAQLLTIPVNLEKYKKVKKLSIAKRGNKGFGSYGVE